MSLLLQRTRIFFKRLSDAFEDEFGSTPIFRFHIPKNYSWKAIRNHGADGRLGEFTTQAMRDVARLNPDLQGVLDIKDHNERQPGQRTLDEDRLGALIEFLSRHRLGLKECRP